MNLFSFLRGHKTDKSENIIKTVPISVSQYKIVGKMLTGYDIDYMYNAKSDIPMLCKYCHSRLECVPNLDYVVKDTKHDIMYTYDSYCIVSEKFKNFCKANNYPNLRFVKLNKCNFFYFEPLGIFKTYINNPLTKLGEWCSHCKRYASICGGVFKKKDFLLPTNDFILRTDTFRGSRENKSPMIIVGFETEKKMKNFGLRGLCFGNVYG